jgi:hypothetical protein
MASASAQEQLRFHAAEAPVQQRRLASLEHGGGAAAGSTFRPLPPFAQTFVGSTPFRPRLSSVAHAFIGSSSSRPRPLSVAHPLPKARNCEATPTTPANCRTFVKDYANRGKSLHNQYMLASYGAIQYDYPPFDEILTRAGCKRNDTRWDAFDAGYRASPAALGIAPCRSQPHWCPLPAADAADAPLQTHGSVPCVLPLRCPGFRAGFRFHPAPGDARPGDARAPGQRRTLQCLRDKVIVFLGDSVMRELFTEW